MVLQQSFTLVNPQSGSLAFKLFLFDHNNPFDHIQRLHYYSLIWIKKGKGTVKADFSALTFSADTLFAFAPYQPFMLQPEEEIEGVVLHFHPDFFCIHKHQDEVACNGVLFNNIYEPPFVRTNEQTNQTFDLLIDQMKLEMQQPAMAQYESLVSYLKIFLIWCKCCKQCVG